MIYYTTKYHCARRSSHLSALQKSFRDFTLHLQCNVLPSAGTVRSGRHTSSLWRDKNRLFLVCTVDQCFLLPDTLLRSSGLEEWKMKSFHVEIAWHEPSCSYTWWRKEKAEDASWKWALKTAECKSLTVIWQLFFFRFKKYVQHSSKRCCDLKSWTRFPLLSRTPIRPLFKWVWN